MAASTNMWTLMKTSRKANASLGSAMAVPRAAAMGRSSTKPKPKANANANAIASVHVKATTKSTTTKALLQMPCLPSDAARMSSTLPTAAFAVHDAFKTQWTLTQHLNNAVYWPQTETNWTTWNNWPSTEDEMVLLSQEAREQEKIESAQVARLRADLLCAVQRADNAEEKLCATEDTLKCVQEKLEERDLMLEQGISLTIVALDQWNEVLDDRDRVVELLDERDRVVEQALQRAEDAEMKLGAVEEDFKRMKEKQEERDRIEYLEIGVMLDSVDRLKDSIEELDRIAKQAEQRADDAEEKLGAMEDAFKRMQEEQEERDCNVSGPIEAVKVSEKDVTQLRALLAAALTTTATWTAAADVAIMKPLATSSVKRITPSTTKPPTRATARVPSVKATASIVRPAWNSSTRIVCNTAAKSAALQSDKTSRRVQRMDSTDSSCTVDTVVARVTYPLSTSGGRPRKQQPLHVQQPRRLPDCVEEEPLDGAMLACARGQERAAQKLALMLRQLVEINDWRVEFEHHELVVFSTATDDRPTVHFTGEAVYCALSAQSKMLDSIVRECCSKLDGVSHTSRAQEWLVVRQATLFNYATQVQNWLSDLMAMIEQVTGISSDVINDSANSATGRLEHDNASEGTPVWHLSGREHENDDPTLGLDVREMCDQQRQTVDVDMALLKSAAKAVRRFLVHSFGAWATSLDIDTASNNAYDTMMMISSVQRDVKTRLERFKQDPLFATDDDAMQCEWWSEQALESLFESATTAVERQLIVCSMAIFRVEDRGRTDLVKLNRSSTSLRCRDATFPGEERYTLVFYHLALLQVANAHVEMLHVDLDGEHSDSNRDQVVRGVVQRLQHVLASVSAWVDPRFDNETSQRPIEKAGYADLIYWCEQMLDEVLIEHEHLCDDSMSSSCEDIDSDASWV